MSRTSAYVLIQIVVLVFYLLRPIIPYVEYSVQKAYIVKNLCVNRDKPNSSCEGKCYLEKQVKKSIDTDDNTGKTSNKKIQNEEVKEFLSVLITVPKATESEIVLLHFSEEKTNTPFLPSPFIPPQERILI
jgi:hypothetical protein